MTILRENTMKHCIPHAICIAEIRTVFLVHILCVFLLSNRAFAQVDLQSYTVQRLSQDNGLSQGSNYFMHEDSHGFMWLTANDAINRYDGNMVKVYNLKRYFKNCPPLQQGYGFAEDTSGNLYIGSVNGLYIYHPDIDKFTLSHVFPGTEKLTMPFAYSNGYIWCFNKRYELATYSVATGKVTIENKMPLPPIESVHIYNGIQSTLYDRWPFMDKNGIIWTPGEQELYSFDPTTKKTKYVKCPSLFSCYYDSVMHTVMIGTAKSLLLYNPVSNTMKEEFDGSNLQIQKINSVCFNSHLTVFSTNRGLLVKERRSDQIVWLKSYASKFNYSYGLNIDKAGRIWVCDDGMGMSVYDFNPQPLPKISSDNYTSSLINTRGISQFAELPDGRILTHGNLAFDRKTRLLHRIPVPIDENTLSSQTVETGKEGVWLVLLKDDRLNIFLLANDSYTKMFAQEAADSLGICHNFKIFEDGTALLSFSKGLYLLTDKKLRRVPGQPEGNPFVINRLYNNQYAISYLYGDMWLAEKDVSGLHFSRKILPGLQSFYVAEDSTRQRFWVATNQGVYLLDRHWHTLHVFDANTGLAGTYIYGLLLDEEGNAWCSHQRGLSSIHAASLEIINYDKSDGIQDWDYNNRAFYKAKDGTLFFGGVSGFNYFLPPIRFNSAYKPTVYIDEILVNNKVWQPDTNADLHRQLQLSHVQNNIVIKAVVKDLMYGAARKLIYRIRETDTRWKELSPQSNISLNSMAPGDYTLDLGIIDKYKKTPVVQKTVFISITAPFYLKSWFMVLCGIGISSAAIQGLMLGRKVRKKNRLRQRQELEQQRKKITADLHDDIGASLSSLQINSIVACELINIQPVQASEVLKQIAMQSKELSVRMGDIIWSMKPPEDAFMSLSARIGNFAIEMMGNTNMHYQIDIEKSIENKITDITLRKNILLIVKEAINNSVKHSAATELAITLKPSRNKAILCIQDNGKGFDTDAAYNGNGLPNLKQRAAEMNAGMEIRSTSDGGTAIIVDIPFTAN